MYSDDFGMRKHLSELRYPVILTLETFFLFVGGKIFLINSL